MSEKMTVKVTETDDAIEFGGLDITLSKQQFMVVREYCHYLDQRGIISEAIDSLIDMFECEETPIGKQHAATLERKRNEICKRLASNADDYVERAIQTAAEKGFLIQDEVWADINGYVREIEREIGRGI